MLSGNVSNSTIASLALAVAAVMLLGLVFLVLMYVFSSGTLGMMNDVCNSLAAFLSVALAVLLYAQHQARSPQLATPALIAAIAGALFALVGSYLVMSGRTGFFLAGMYTMIGYALIGLWLLSLSYSGVWPRGLAAFSLIAGGIMALGIASIPSIFMRIDSFGTAAWHTWIGQVGFLGWAILYPIWCLRLWALLRLR